MIRRPVDSSVIASVGYDDAVALLDVEFVSGEVYRYFAVPRSVHEGLLAAPSKGRFFQQHIRDRYPTQRL